MYLVYKMTKSECSDAEFLCYIMNLMGWYVV